MKMVASEKIYADNLSKRKIRYVYPCKRFVMGEQTYRPDFYLPDKDLYVEVMNSFLTKEKLHKLETFKKYYPDVKIKIVDINDRPIKVPTRIKNDNEYLFIKAPRRCFYIDRSIIEKLNDATYFYRKETKKHLSMSALLNMCLTKMTARQILKHCLDCNERGK